MLSLSSAMTLGLAPRTGGGGTPTPTPVSNIVIEGDSITMDTPGADTAGFYSTNYKASQPGKTINIRAEGSRSIGTSGNLNDNGNTLMGNVSEDIAYGPQLVTAMIGTNDMSGGSTTATYKTNLTAYGTAIRSGTARRFAWSPPIAMNPTGTPHPSYATFMARRATLLTDCRDPAVWGAWADYYFPMGEYPDFGDAALAAPLFGDTVHPSTAGQTLLYNAYKPAIDTLIDAARASSTAPYSSVWPANETNLTTSTEIVRRLIVSGLAHTGTALGIGVSGGGAQIRLNGGAYGTEFGKTSGNGYRLYNGDVIDLKLTTSASNNTAVNIDLTIGSETRTISYTTVAVVTPATIAGHGFWQNTAPSTTLTQSFTFEDGLALIVLTSPAAPSSVTVGGNAATLIDSQVGASADLTIRLYSVAVVAGSRTVTANFSVAADGTRAQMFAGTVKNADPTPTSTPKRYVANESSPHANVAATVPASGVYLAAYYQNGNAGTNVTVTPASMVEYGQDETIYQSSARILCVAISDGTSGSITASFASVFGSYPRLGVVFKAFGT